MAFEKKIDMDLYDEITLSLEILNSMFRYALYDEGENLEKSGEAGMYLHLLWDQVIKIEEAINKAKTAEVTLQAA